jgi:hypothetical protein
VINWPFTAVTVLEVPQLLWRLFFALKCIYKSHVHGIKEVGSTDVFRCMAVVTPVYIADFNCPVIDSCLNRNQMVCDRKLIF